MRELYTTTPLKVILALAFSFGYLFISPTHTQAQITIQGNTWWNNGQTCNDCCEGSCTDGDRGDYCSDIEWTQNGPGTQAYCGTTNVTVEGDVWDADGIGCGWPFDCNSIESRTVSVRPSSTNPAAQVFTVGTAGSNCWRDLYFDVWISGSYPCNADDSGISNDDNLCNARVAGSCGVGGNNYNGANWVSNHTMDCDDDAWYRYYLSDAGRRSISWTGDKKGGDITAWTNITEVRYGSTSNCNSTCGISDAGINGDFSVSSPLPGYYWVRIEEQGWPSNITLFDIDVSKGGYVASGDLFCSAIDVGTINIGSSPSGSGNNANATTEELCSLDEPNNNDNDETIWYKFTVGNPAPSAITVNIDNSALCTPWVAVYRQTSNPSCPFSGSTNGFNAITHIETDGVFGDVTINCPSAGQIYYFQVEATGLCDTDPFSWYVTAVASSSAGDFCTNATTLGSGTLTNGGTLGSSLPLWDNICAGNAGDPDPPCLFGIDKGVWFTFTTAANVSGFIDIEAYNTGSDNIDLQVAIYKGPCGSLLHLDCDFDTGEPVLCAGGLCDEFMENVCVEPSTTYYILIDGGGVIFSYTEGDFGLLVRHKTPSPNDNICGTLPVASATLNTWTPENVFTNNINGTNCNDPNPSCFTNDQGVWIRTTAPGRHLWMDADNNTGDDINYQIAVYTTSDNTCTGGLVEVGCDADNILWEEDIALRCLDPNKTYWILVDGADLPLLDDEQGNIDIDFYYPREGGDQVCQHVPINGTGTDVVPMGGFIELVNNANFCATAIGDPDPSSWDPDKTVWYSFVAPTYIPEPTRLTSVIIKATNVSAFSFITEPELTDAIDLQLALYDMVSGSPCSSPVLFPHVDEYDPGGICPDDLNPLCDEDMVATCLTPGRRYYLMVDGSGINVEGLFDLRVEDYNELDAPNDDACNAIDFGTAGHPTWNLVNREVEIEFLDHTNYCADNINEPLPSNWPANVSSVWYTFTAPPSGKVHISSENTALPLFSDQIDIAVAVYENLPDCSNPDVGETEVGSDYQFGGFCDGEDLTVECLTPGATYYLMLTGVNDILCPDGDYGEYNVSITSDPRDPVATNDDICNPIHLGTVPSDLGASTLYPKISGGFGTGTGTIPNPGGWNNNDYPFNNFCASTVAGDPAPNDWWQEIGDDLDETVWFTFVAPSTGSIQIDAYSGPIYVPFIDEYKDAIDLQIAVYESSDDACTGNLFEIKSDYDLGFNDETVEVHCLDPGRTYFLMIDGADFGIGGSQGYFGLELQEIVPDPSPWNDYVCMAKDLGNAYFTGPALTIGADTNICATFRISDVDNSSEPDPSDFDLDKTVWYSFTAPISGVPPEGAFAVQIDIDGALGIPFFGGDWVDPQIAVWEQTTGTASCDHTTFVEIASEYDPIPPFLETAEAYCIQPGYTYYIQIDGSLLNTQGYFELTIDDYAPITIPPNDEVANHVGIGNVSSVPTNIIGSDAPGFEFHNYCSDLEAGEPNPFSILLDDVDNTVWFSYAMPPGAPYAGNYLDGTVILKTDPNNAYDDIYLMGAVFESTDNSPTFGNFIENNAEGTAPSWDEDIPFTCMEPGQTFYLQVDGYSGPFGLFRSWGQGYFTVEVQTDDLYPNYGNDNRCATAVNLGVVPDGGSIPRGATYNNKCATSEGGEPDPWTFTDPDNSVWFTFVAPTSGNVTIDIDGVAGDIINIVGAVYEAPGGCGAQLVFVESGETQPLFDEDIVVSCLTGGNTYYLQVDGMGLLGEDIGTFNIEIRDDGGVTTRPYNNDFCDVQDGTAAAADFGDVTNQNILKAGESNFCANIEAGEPASGAQRTVWYKFTAPASGRVNITVSDADGLFGLEPEAWLYGHSGAACSGVIIQGSFTELDYSYDIFGDENIDYECLVPGNTYYVRVDGIDIFGLGTQGVFDIRIQDMIPGYIAPGNDECNLQAAYELTVQDEACFLRSGTWNINNTGFASYNYGNPTISANAANTCGANCGDIWYSFIMPSTGLAYVEGYDNILLDFSEIVIQAYSGTCGALVPIECGNDDSFLGAVAYEIIGTPGERIYLQIFDEDGDQFDEDFDLCVSKRCGADDCDNMLAMPSMTLDSLYCWDVETATGESIPADRGWQECGVNNDPDNSVYYSFTTDDFVDFCGDYSITVYMPDLGGAGLCPIATSGLTISVYEDATPCDGTADRQLDCELIDDCDPENGFWWTQTYPTAQAQGGGDSIEPNTTYYIQIDGWGQVAPGQVEDGSLEITRSCEGRMWELVTDLGITESDGYCEDAQGWRHYYDDNNTLCADDDFLMFSVHPRGNLFEGVATIDILDTGAPYYTAQSTPAEEGSWVMKRLWDFKITSGGITGNPVDIRFYYAQSEKDDIISAAQTFAAVNGLIYEPFEWFKSADGTDFDPSIHITPPRVIAEYGSWSGPAMTGHNELIPTLAPQTFPFTEDWDAIDFIGAGNNRDVDNEWCNGVRWVEIGGLTGFSGGSGATGAAYRQSPLPVELVSFVGWNEGNVNKLEWVTLSEINNELFVVERSANSIDFLEIGSVPGHGTTSEEHTYNLTDFTPIQGLNYYRLKIIDFDGTYEYSPVIVIEYLSDDLETAIVLMHPNPTLNLINIQLQSATQTKFDMVVLDVTGRVVFRDVIEADAGLNSPFILDASTYNQGVYIVQMTDQATGMRLEAKFVKQ